MPNPYGISTGPSINPLQGVSLWDVAGMNTADYLAPLLDYYNYGNYYYQPGSINLDHVRGEVGSSEKYKGIFDYNTLPPGSKVPHSMFGMNTYDTEHYTTTREGGWMTDSGLSDNFFDGLNLNLTGSDVDYWNEMAGAQWNPGAGFGQNILSQATAFGMNLGNTLKSYFTQPADLMGGTTLQFSAQYYGGHDVENPEEYACRDYMGFPTSCLNPSTGMVNKNLAHDHLFQDGPGNQLPCAYGPCYYDNAGEPRSRYASLGSYEDIALTGTTGMQFEDFLEGSFDQYGENIMQEYSHNQGVKNSVADHLGIDSMVDFNADTISEFLVELNDRHTNCLTDPEGCQLSDEMQKFEIMRDDGFSFQQLRDGFGLDPAEYLSVKYDNLLGAKYDDTAEQTIREASIGNYGSVAKTAYDRFASEIGTGEMSENQFKDLIQASASYERTGDIESILDLRSSYVSQMNENIASVASKGGLNQYMHDIWLSSPESLEYLEDRYVPDWEADYNLNPTLG